MMPVLPDIDDLSLAAQAAQMVVVRTTGHLFDHEIQYPDWEADRASLSYALESLGIGGVILLGGSAAEVGLRSQQLQSQSDIPLLIAADIEEGVGQRFSGATWFPPPMALGEIAGTDITGADVTGADVTRAIALAEAFGEATAQEALAIGLNWILAPVVDVNNNPENPVINVRAFGESPALVAALAEGFIRGSQRHPVLTTAKHFPGHGDTALDSHVALPTLHHSLNRLKAIELPPFQRAIAAGVDAVMTAHINLPAVDQTHPATLSAAILTGLLRRDLGFDGLIVTDALIMGAIADRYGPDEAAILAIEAGADILLMPADPAGTIAAVIEAVTIGRLSPQRVRASVERIWRAKLKVAAAYNPVSHHPHAWEQIQPAPVNLNHLAQPQVRQWASDILSASQQLRGTISDSPQQACLPARNLIVVDDLLDCQFLGRTAPAIAHPRERGYSLHIADSRTLPPKDTPLESLPTLLQVFIRGNPFRSVTPLTQLAEAWLQWLIQSNTLQGLVIYGSPYVRDRFLPQISDTLPFGFTYGQMPEAQAILLANLFTDRTASETKRDRIFTD
ncbi:MAG: glycoside hydrolase family 3 N-terminal domain-containing protein [Cyanobacteria bacterium P01_D01_bin.128]